MYTINSNENMSDFAAQDDFDISSVGIDYQPSLGLGVVTGSIDPSVCNFTAASAITNSTSPPNQLPQDSRHWYGSFDNLDTISKVCEGDFLHEYAISCGYKLSEDFLSDMNKHKINFINKVDSILIALYSTLSFRNFDVSINIMCLMNKYCYYFSKCAYDLRFKCIYILQYEIIPITIKSIFDSKVIDGSSVRNMTYSEMEQLFLHFIATLDKLIMAKIMNYWRDFYNNKKKYIASLVSGIDYSNPFFCASNFDRITAPSITCPVAFTSKFGEYISFIAIAKIDDMVREFIGKCNDGLKRIISSKCSYMYNYIDGVCSDPRELRDEIKVLIKEEFSQSVIKEGIKDKFINFLKNAVIWNENNDLEVTRLFIYERIVRYMNKLLVNIATRDAYNIINNFHEKFNIIKSFHEKLWSSEKSLSSFGKYFPTIEDRWGVKIHPEDDINIISIKREFIAKSREVIRDKFCSMIEEKYEFLDGSVIGVVIWGNISKKLLPIAQETVKHLVDEEYAELSRFLSNVRVVECVSALDKFSTCTRKITSEEIDKILKIFVNSIHARNRHLFSDVWKNLISSTKFNISEQVVLNEKCLLIDYKYNYNYLSIIENRWGVKLHPGEDKLIFTIVKNFSVNIKNHLTKLFSRMLESGGKLPNGMVICNYSWGNISKELLPFAIKSSSLIIEEHYKKIDKVLSESRIIVEVSKDRHSAYIARKITDVEKDNLMIRARKFVDDKLIFNARISWSGVFSKYSKDTECDHKCNVIHGSDEGESSVVKLRYRDDIIILNIRKAFSSRIKKVVRDKFNVMLSNKHKINNVFIGSLPWADLSRKLYSIAKKEIRPILKEERKELEKIVYESRAVVNSEVDRELTEKEKSMVLEQLMSNVVKRLRLSFRMAWGKATNDFIERENCAATTSSDVNCLYSGKGIHASDREVSWGKEFCYKLCYRDNIDILNTRKKFSSRIKRVVCDKFNVMLSNKYKINKVFIGSLTWRDVSGELYLVAKKEVDPILEEEREALEKIVCRARAVVNSEVDRELTEKEKSMVLEQLMSRVNKMLRFSFAISWNKVTNDFREREDFVATTSSDVSCVGEIPTSSTCGTNAVDKDGILMVKLSREDDLAISNIRRQFSSKFYSFVGNKFSEMISKKYKLDDDTVVGICPWKSISKKLFPIIRKEINPILEKERVKISEMLLKSRVDVSPAASVGVVMREPTPEERSNLLETIMASVSKKVEAHFSVIWAKTIELLSTICITDLKEEYRLELDNIKIEFFGNLGSIVNDVIHSLPVDVYESPARLENIKSYFSGVVSKIGHDLFEANGFLSRVESLLSNAQVFDSYGNYRKVTGVEKGRMFKEFMDIIAHYRDCLVKKRIVSRLKGISIAM